MGIKEPVTARYMLPRRVDHSRREDAVTRRASLKRMDQDNDLLKRQLQRILPSVPADDPFAYLRRVTSDRELRHPTSTPRSARGRSTGPLATARAILSKTSVSSIASAPTTPRVTSQKTPRGGADSSVTPRDQIRSRSRSSAGDHLTREEVFSAMLRPTTPTTPSRSPRPHSAVPFEQSWGVSTMPLRSDQATPITPRSVTPSTPLFPTTPSSRSNTPQQSILRYRPEDEKILPEETAELRHKIENLQGELREVRALVAVSQVDKHAQEKKEAELLLQLKESDELNSKHQARILQLENKLTTALQQVSRQQLSEDETGEITRLQAELKDMRTASTQSNSHTMDLQATVKDLERQIYVANEKMKLKEEEFGALAATHLRLTQEHQKTQAAILHGQARESQLEAKLNALQLQHDSITQQHRFTDAIHSDAGEKILELEFAVRAAQEEAALAKARAEKASADVSDLRNKLDEAEDTLESLEETVRTQNLHADEQKQAVSRLTEELEKSQQEITNLYGQLSDTMTAQHTAEELADSLSTDLKAAQAKIEELTGKLTSQQSSSLSTPHVIEVTAQEEF